MVKIPEIISRIKRARNILVTSFLKELEIYW